MDDFSEGGPVPYCSSLDKAYLTFVIQGHLFTVNDRILEDDLLGTRR